MTSPDTRPIVLIVDDDVPLANLVRSVLIEAGFDAHAVYTGKTAREWLNTNVPDAVVLDIMMPDIDGFTLLKEIRADERTGLQPVIMLSARVDQIAQQRSKEAGADAYFVKPAPFDELIEELRSKIEFARTGPLGKESLG